MNPTAPFLAALALAFPLHLAAQDSRPAKEEKPAPAPTPEELAEALPSSEDSADRALKQIAAFIKDEKVNTKRDRWKAQLTKPPVLEFTPKREYHWHLATNKGVIDVRLMPDVAPMHVSSTIYLARLGFYDDLKFHRVIPKFMAQGGCPFGSGTGSPGYAYDGEFDPKVKHDRPGLLSMANAGPGTDGSQFFLTFVPTPHLDGRHTIFGEVVEGMETLKELEKCGSPGGRTTEPLRILRTTITVVDPPSEEPPAEAPAEEGEDG